MEQFKKRLIVQQYCLAIGIIGLIIAFIFSHNYESVPSAIGHFIEGFQAGISITLVCIFLFLSHRAFAAIRNADKLRKLYISETDERALLIRQKSGSAGMNIVMYGLTVGAFIAGNFNEIVCLTLLGACIFVGLVRGFFKLYYRAKI